MGIGTRVMLAMALYSRLCYGAVVAIRTEALSTFDALACENYELFSSKTKRCFVS
jgi:hypothetical protein